MKSLSENPKCAPYPLGKITLRSNDLYFLIIYGVTAIRCSNSKFSLIEPIFIYKRNIAIKIKIQTTKIDPQRTNLVKLFQVFLWFSLSIKLFLSCFEFWISFINYINSTSSSDQFRV